jgi:hypothetical protein
MCVERCDGRKIEGFIQLMKLAGLPSLYRVCFTPEPRQTDAAPRRASHHTPEFTHFSVSDVCECCNQFGRQGAKIAHLAAVSFLRVISAQFAEGIR